MARYIVYTTHCEYEFNSIKEVTRTLKKYNYTGEAYVYSTKNDTTEAHYYASGKVIIKTPKFNGKHTPSTNTINVMSYL